MEDKAKRYAAIKYKLALTDIIYTLFLLIMLQASPLAYTLKTGLSGITNQFLVTGLYSFCILLIYNILSFPLSIYGSFVVEHRFNLSNQKIHFWFLDYIKGSILSLLVFVILIEGFFFFIRTYPASWWWMSAVFWIFLSIVIARLFPIIVIPLFFKYKKLQNEDLRTRILALAAKMKVKILDVFEIDFSKKSLKANAAFVGLGKSKRVLLTDTLLSGSFLPEEIEVILAHEFAHYRFRHLIKMVAVNAALTVLIFYAFFLLGQSVIDVTDIANLGAWLFLFMLFHIVITPFTNWMQRVMEKNADGAAIKATGNPGFFISMMGKLADQNLSERKPPLWAKILFYDHPPIDERIKSAESLR